MVSADAGGATLPPDVVAALARAEQVAAGAARGEGGNASDTTHPAVPSTEARNPSPPHHELRWDGERWTRDGGTRIRMDVWGEQPIPPRPFGPGWWVWSTSQRHVDSTADDDMPGNRQGICLQTVDPWPDPETGELTELYVCLEERRNELLRLDVPAADVHGAVEASVRDLTGLCRKVHAYAARPNGRVVAGRGTDRGWLVGTAPALVALGAKP